MNPLHLSPAYGRLTAAFLFLAISSPLSFVPATACAETTHPATQKGAPQKGYQRLAGTWVRSDGGYMLELKDIKQDGSLKASYYNPRSINVSNAELHTKDGRITLLIELRDINYPGSTYDLRYDPAEDRLTGTYFQAVERQTYDIEFRRLK